MAEKKALVEASKPDDGIVAQEVAIELPIEWHFGPEVVSRYANQAIVQAGQNECFVSYFEVRPPTLTGPTDLQNQAKELKSIRAECVARVVMPHELLSKMIRAFQEITERTQQREAAALNESKAAVPETVKKESA